MRGQPQAVFGDHGHAGGDEPACDLGGLGIGAGQHGHAAFAVAGDEFLGDEAGQGVPGGLGIGGGGFRSQGRDADVALGTGPIPGGVLAGVGKGHATSLLPLRQIHLGGIPTGRSDVAGIVFPALAAREGPALPLPALRRSPGHRPLVLMAAPGAAPGRQRPSPCRALPGCRFLSGVRGSPAPFPLPRRRGPDWRPAGGNCQPGSRVSGSG